MKKIGKIRGRTEGGWIGGRSRGKMNERKDDRTKERQLCEK